MIQSISPDGSLFLTNLERIQRRIDTAQRQLSSGTRVERASDDPSAVVEVLQLQADLAINGQIRSNLERDKSEIDVGERVIQEAVRLVERVAVLGAQSAGSLTSAGQRQQILEEVRGIHQQLISISQTLVNGRYIFSGDEDNTPMYASDPAGSGGVERLQNSLATREVHEPGGTSFVAARTAADIFDARDPGGDPLPGNVFVAVQTLIDGLSTNNTAVIASNTALIDEASTHLNSELSHYGVSQNRISAAISTAAQYELQFRVRLSQTRDADLAVAATELSQARLHEQATISAQAGNRRRSLFDFLG